MDINQFLPPNNYPTFDSVVNLRRQKRKIRGNLTLSEQIVVGTRILERLAQGDITKSKIASLLETTGPSVTSWIKKAELHFHGNHGINIHEHIQGNTRAQYHAFVTGNTVSQSETENLTATAVDSLNQNLSRIIDDIAFVKAKVTEHDNFINGFRGMFGGMVGNHNPNPNPPNSHSSQKPFDS